MTFDNTLVRCGLEVHIQLNYLKTKLFCECSTDYSSKEINENTCPICTGLPGTLPNINGTAIEKGLALAKALKMTIPNKISFKRKHYDYTDLPKGFQITQSDVVLGKDGWMPISSRTIPIKQIQLEEDPAKIIRQDDIEIIDYNRSGITLIELVTDPIFKSKDEIEEFLFIYRMLVKSLRLSDTFKEGALRVDLNVSYANHPRVEVKNIGSDTEILRAFEYESVRQSQVFDVPKLNETRWWDKENGITLNKRVKEEAVDYHYLPEKNIPVIEIPKDLLQKIDLPQLPWEKVKIFQEFYKLEEFQIKKLLKDELLEKLYLKFLSQNETKRNVINTFFWKDLMEFYNSNDEIIIHRIHSLEIEPILSLLKQIESGELTKKLFRNKIRKYFIKGKPFNLNVDKTLDEFSLEHVMSYLSSNYSDIWESSFKNTGQLNYLVGQGMKFSKGKLKPKILLQALKERTII